MPLDIEKLRLRLPDAFSDDSSDEDESHNLDIPKRQPIPIWNPEDAFGPHPVDAIFWAREEVEVIHADLEGRIEGQLRERGLDVLAWYRSYHVDRRWGNGS
jgi:hypothetical protein